MSSINSITDDSFENEVANSPDVVLVDFWAAWCGPCKALSPKLEELSTQWTGKVKFVKMDVDANHQVPARFGIRGIPTLILFKGGKMVDQLVGNQSKDVIEDLLRRSV